MIRFDSSSIYNRALAMLKQDLDWKDIANDSVISSLLKANAETNAETARYAEYLFKESKWDTAQNTSSIISMANMLGYKPKRKISASGTLIISTDPKIFNASYYTDVSTYISNTLTEYEDATIYLNASSKIVDSNGNQYITDTCALSSKDKYTTINIIQGVRKTILVNKDTIKNTYTESKLNKFIYIPVVIKNCENASTDSTKRLFRVFIDSYTNGEVYHREYRIVSSLLLSSSSDYDVEVYNDIYNTDLFYFKFNNDKDRGNVLDLTSNSSLTALRVEYVESAGATGNNNILYNKFTITNAYIKSNGTVTDFNGTLYGINNTLISGGKDEETIDDIKENAPKYYMTSYTIGTKESYENAITGLDISITDSNVTFVPKKVSVYYGTTIENDQVVDATMVTFLADGLDDLATSLSADDSYSDINDKLDSYLSYIKSPQDRLVFQSPNYVSYALGIQYFLTDDSSVKDSVTLTDDIQELVDDNFGSNSDNLDFLSDYSTSDVINTIYNTFEDVKIDADITLEAVKKINWNDAVRMCPTRTVESSDDTQQYLHTVRVPFSFSSVFIGEKTQKGFIDYRSNASYTLRVDIIYNKGNSSLTTDFDSSIFICDSNISTSERGEKDSYFVVRDTGYDSSTESYWPNLKSYEEESTGERTYDVSKLTADYEDLKNSIAIPDKDCWQVSFRDKVYNDDQIEQMREEIENGTISTYTSSSVNKGCLENFIIYVKKNYSTSSTDDKLVEGFIEMDFDSICSVLNTYRQNIDTQVLKCGLNNEISNDWNSFLKSCNNIVHIYVSMRPIDNTSINISNNDDIPKNTVLYIDSHDSIGTYDSSFSNKKLNRMISVQYKD